VPHEKEDGSVEEMPIFEAFNIVRDLTITRGFRVLTALAPELDWYAITPHDRRYKRNVNHVKAAFIEIVEERKKEH